MKLLFYISTIRGGGAGRVMVNLANQFHMDGTEITFVTNFQADTEYSLDPKIRRYSIEQSESNELFALKNINRVKNLRRIIKLEKPDLLVSFLKENDYRAFLATRWLPCKLVLSIRNDPQRLYGGFFRGIAAKYIYGRADAVIFQTKDAQRWFSRLRGVSAVIQNQVNPTFYAVKQVENKTPLIASVGKLMQQKNHKLLIEAFASVVDQIGANLVIYGEGPLRAELQSLIKKNHLEDRVFLPGNVKDVPGVLARVSLFVLPSDYEGMPNALMEAMAAGVPCISTDCPCGGPREILPKELLVPVGDVHALAEKMVLMLTSHHNLYQYSHICRTAAKEFQPETIFQKWKNFLSALVCNQSTDGG